MKRLDLKLSLRCNNNCLFCILGSQKSCDTDRSTLDLKNQLFLARKDNTEKVVFTGGEPTLRKDLFSLIKYAKELGYLVIHVESNGRMMSYQSYAKKLVDSGANSFSITLHSHNQELYEKTSNAHGFSEVISGIKNLSMLTNNLSINIPLTKLNYLHLHEIIDILIETGVKSVNMPFVNPEGSALINKDLVVPRLTDVKGQLDCAIKRLKSRGIVVTTEMIPFCILEDRTVKCDHILDDISINSYNLSDPDFKTTRLLSRVKPISCKDCIFDLDCEGVTKRYGELFGLDELKPVKHE